MSVEAHLALDGSREGMQWNHHKLIMTWTFATQTEATDG